MDCQGSFLRLLSQSFRPVLRVLVPLQVAPLARGKIAWAVNYGH
jgi:hypothetical protein